MNAVQLTFTPTQLDPVRNLYLASNELNWKEPSGKNAVPSTEHAVVLPNNNSTNLLWDIITKVSSITFSPFYTGVVVGENITKKVLATNIYARGGTLALQTEDDLIIPAYGSSATTGVGESARTLFYGENANPPTKGIIPINFNRCPKCFSKFEDLKWTNDPILTKNGAKFVYDEGTGILVPEPNIAKRNYKGCTLVTNKHIKELQDANEDNKPTGGWTPVIGTPETLWTPNKIHIKELREAIEKGLESTGQTKEEYFNYDEDGVERQNPHQLDWNDPTLTSDIWKDNIRDMHIEDLRKSLLGLWAERFNITPPETYWDTTSYINKTQNIAPIDTSPVIAHAKMEDTIYINGSLNQSYSNRVHSGTYNGFSNHFLNTTFSEIGSGSCIWNESLIPIRNTQSYMDYFNTIIHTFIPPNSRLNYNNLYFLIDIISTFNSNGSASGDPLGTFAYFVNYTKINLYWNYSISPWEFILPASYAGTWNINLGSEFSTRESRDLILTDRITKVEVIGYSHTQIACRANEEYPSANFSFSASGDLKTDNYLIKIM